MARLDLAGVTKSFGGVQVLRKVDMVAEPGSVTALIGPNGAGKTTLLNTISGFVPRDDGSITVGGRQISGLLCARSQVRANYCDNLKNLAFAIEPQANPIRPTLRDGH